MSLAIRPVVGYDDLQRWVATRNAASSDAITVEMRALVRAREMDSVDLIAEHDGEPVGIAFLSGDPHSLDSRRPWFEVRVRAEHRHRGVGSALLRDVVDRAKRAGHAGLRCSARADDADSLAFLRGHGFSVTRSIEQVSLALDPLPTLESPTPDGVRLLRLADEPALVQAMYELAVSTAGDRTDRLGGIVPTEPDWRVYELSSPFVHLEMTAVATAENKVVGYSVIQDFPGHDALLHRTLAVASGWREQGLAQTLVTEAIRDAAAAGVPWLIAMPESQFEAEVFASLGYELRERWLEHERLL
jgi:ribosomal protein S18 acetylase RimI-like enzyme